MMAGLGGLQLQDATVRGSDGAGEVETPTISPELQLVFNAVEENGVPKLQKALHRPLLSC